MSEVERVSLAIDRELLGRFDAIVERAGHGNRSEAMRDLIRNRLAEDEWTSLANGPVVATVTLVYDHKKRELSDRLIEVGHDHHDAVISTLHVHLDPDRCLEIIALRGDPAPLRAIADRLVMMKGVEQGRVVFTAARGDRARRESK